MKTVTDPNFRKLDELAREKVFRRLGEGGSYKLLGPQMKDYLALQDDASF